jgi:nitroimidazol reductase NimA-like FMN-containing flavoprotein (pyridoxamine 5'-phosphate oxidase superfamily)
MIEDAIDGREQRRVEELSRQECLTLLGTVPIGRVAVPREGSGPLVVPVNFVLDGDVVVFRSDPGTKLRALRSAPISFEADNIDAYHRTGWSVLVEGAAYEATRWEVEHLALEPWAGGAKSHWIRLLPAAITGRMVVAPPDAAADDRGYR